MANKTTTATVKTKAPTGLAIARSGKTIKFSWKIGDSDYKDGQQFIWWLNGKKQGNTINLSATTTSRSVTIDPSKYISRISFSVRGNRATYKSKEKTYSPGWSDWVNKGVDITLPPAPSVSFSLGPEDDPFAGTFSWSISSASSTSFAIYTGYEWESKLFPKHNSYSPPTNWSSTSAYPVTRGSGASTGWSRTIKEDSAYFEIPKYSYTRWFRIRSIGPRGKSAWRYARHTYALPLQTAKTSAKLSKKAANSGYMCTAAWVAEKWFMYPIDKDTVQYAIGTPVTTGTLSGKKYTTTWSAPTSLSWNEASGVNDSEGWDALTFSIEDNLGEDELCFVRVNTKHDYQTVNGPAVIARNAVGYLPEITGITITPNADTHRVTVQATNNSSLTASFIAIYYRTDSNPGSYTCVGIIPHDNSETTVQCPNWGTSNISIGVRALLADYTMNGNGISYTTYTISNLKMSSGDIQWQDGSVPGPPKSLSCTGVNGDSIRVTWDWSSWASANQTELSWSDHENAWESTEEPSSYIVNNLYSGRWTISGLDVGTWYVRARLLRDLGDSVVTGVWSAIKEVKLSSAPESPSIVVSDGAVTPDGSIICYWTYISTDGSSQSQSDICEATYNSSTGTYAYGSPFAKTTTDQHITISAKARGWQSGEIHYIAVRVISASGESSEWSVPQAITVVDPLVCDITSTSLVDEQVHTEEYVETADTEIISGKTYYTRSGEEGAYVYTPVSNPTTTDLENYFEEIIETDTYLTELPLTVTVSGNGRAVQTTLSVVRSKSYHMLRPDDKDYDGFEGEAVIIKTFDGYGLFQLGRDDLIGHLDDGAEYKLIATVSDSYGQMIESEKSFTVRWFHQAIIPTGTVSIDEEHDAAILVPMLPVPPEPAGTVNRISRSENLSAFTVESRHVVTDFLTDSCTATLDVEHDKLLGIYYDVNVNPGDIYTLSLYASSVSGTVQIGIGDLTPESTRSNWQGLHAYSDVVNGRNIIGLTIPDDCDCIRIYIGMQHAGTTATLSKVQLEYGTQATDWVPSQEDAMANVDDVCDIYRMSVDGPQLIFEGAKFGEKYVDPYPTIGDNGGYRFVYRTYNDDYTTSDGHIAWFHSSDIPSNKDYLDVFTSIIDFGTARVALPYNLSLNNRWSKDFQQTTYLGGHIQGDWNPAVSRTASLNSTSLVTVEYGSNDDHHAVETMRRLAIYPGVCHVRTPDGSSYSANVDVTEDREEKWITKLAKYTLDITRVDSLTLDAMTYADWIASIASEDDIYDIEG